jgi:hypothetical protein
MIRFIASLAVLCAFSPPLARAESPSFERLKKFISGKNSCIFAVGAFYHGPKPKTDICRTLDEAKEGEARACRQNHLVFCAFNAVQDAGTINEWKGCVLANYDYSADRYDGILTDMYGTRAAIKRKGTCSKEVILDLLKANIEKEPGFRGTVLFPELGNTSYLGHKKGQSIWQDYLGVAEQEAKSGGFELKVIVDAAGVEGALSKFPVLGK